jgi:hypothetical protein
MEAAKQAKNTAAQVLDGLSASIRTPVTTRNVLNTHSCGKTAAAFSRHPSLKANDTSDMRSNRPRATSPSITKRYGVSCHCLARALASDFASSGSPTMLSLTAWMTAAGKADPAGRYPGLVAG